MEDPDEHALVVRAITCRTGGGILWRPQVLRRVRTDDSLRGLTPDEIVDELIRHVSVGGPGTVAQRKETREEYRDYDHYYRVIIPLADFPRGLFVEIVIRERVPPEYPVVLIVSVHPQGV